MSQQKPSVPKGTRDFTPAEMVRRNYIFDTIRKIFSSFGYQPIETPSMELLTTLLGKYGDEGDKLIFKILNSGDFLSEVPDETYKKKDARQLSGLISEKGLRYDLTVPFARFVVQHQNELVFPFKRFQIQPVWRADRPQKGRYREFFQCDVDVVGSDSLLYEVELVQIIDEVFTQLGIESLIRLNNRKILSGIAEVIGAPEKLNDITAAMDKLDKTGLEKVNDELAQRGVPADSIAKLQPVLTVEGKIKEKFALLEAMFAGNETGNKGVAELRHVLTTLKALGIRNRFDFDLRLARGLNYYTGTIIEVTAVKTAIGSICGGGRYDDLTGVFGLPGVPGVGISFGADRIYDVLMDQNLFPENLERTTKLLFVNFGSKEELFCLNLINDLRRDGISCEIYPHAAKLKKQMEYASRKNIPFVLLIGEEEMKTGTFTLRDMGSGLQQNLSYNELKDLLKS